MAIIESVPLTLFSGLAADDKVFVAQKIAFPQLVVPNWPTPRPGDTLDSYCDRLAEDLRLDEDAIVGGASFGGIVALHVAMRVQPRAVVLIGSVRSPVELPRIARLARPLKPLTGWIPVRLLQFMAVPFASKLSRRRFPHFGGLMRQFRDCDPTLFKWSLARLIDWSTAPRVECPVFQIHGDHDFVLPMRYTIPTDVVAGGGHVISLTHPKEVNDFIRAAMAKKLNSA